MIKILKNPYVQNTFIMRILQNTFKSPIGGWGGGGGGGGEDNQLKL